MYVSVDPSTGQQHASFAPLCENAYEATLVQARVAFLHAKSLSLSARIQWLQSLADILEQQAPVCAQLMALEMGKPPAQGEAELRKCAVFCRYYAEHSHLLNPRHIKTQAQVSYVTYEPIGPLLAIMPWNFPFLMPFKVIAPAVLLGNPVILKPAPNVPQTSLKLAELVNLVSPVAHFVQTALLTHEQVTSAIADTRIAAVTFTGSQKSGSLIAAQAGLQRKKIIMELGGSDPFIVFEDTDPVAIAQMAAQARCSNSGQSCVSPKRFLVHASLAQTFITHLVTAMGNQTAMGPLASKQQLQTLQNQVNDAVAAGAILHCGGKSVDGSGFYFEPTVISHIKPHMLVAQEEVFGPVAIVETFNSDDEALKLANYTSFGLGASVWTQNPARIERFISALQVGMVFVNSPVVSDVRLPFGGTKDSGFGREQSQEGLFEFANVKTVWIA